MSTRSAVRPVLVTILILVAGVWSTGTAFAHTSLIGSDPADGATVPAAPATVTLTFDESLANFEPLVTVTGPDGNQYQTGAPTLDGARLSIAVAPLPVAGTYTITYRVVSDDGHPVEGQLGFDLPATAVVAPVATTPPAATSPPVPTAASTMSPTPTTGATPAASPTPGSTQPPPTTSAAAQPAAESSGGWSAWQWLMIAVFVILASLASLVIRRRLAAGTNTRVDDGPTDGRSGG